VSELSVALGGPYVGRMDPGFGDVPLFVTVMFVVVPVLFVAIVILAVTSAVRSRKVLRDNGLDPLAAGAQIAARLSRGPLATAPRSLEQRLSELDDLHRRGLISSAEHEAARAAALDGRR
jgi:uncharacterized membrane protein YhdT